MNSEFPAGSEDPMMQIHERDLVDEKSNELSARLSRVLAMLEEDNVLSVEQIESVLIFGPGLSDSQGVYAALESLGEVSPTIHFDVVEGDLRVQAELGYQQSINRLPEELTFWNESFTGFLANPRPEAVSADLVVIHDTGPGTTRPGIGITRELVEPLAECIREGGVLITSGETNQLDIFLANSDHFQQLETTVEQSTFTRGMNVWQRV